MKSRRERIARPQYLSEFLHGSTGPIVGLPLALAATALLAHCCFASGERSPGKADLQRAAESLERGGRFLEQAKYSEAIEAFTAAIRADPGNIEAYHGRAAAYAARGESKRSDDDRETAARLRLADQVKKDAPRFLARSPTFLALFTAVGGAALVLVWLCIRRLNILVGAKAPEWDTEDRPHKRDAP